MVDTPLILIRPARDADADGLIRLIGRCWADYPGCVLDVDGEVPELRALASHFADLGGRAWVADREGEAVGSVAVAAARAGWVELFKLYVWPDLRRAGLGSRLLALAEATGREWGAEHVELWSDTRFVEAHAFYIARGYRMTGETRELHDLSATVEYRFEGTLTATRARNVRSSSL